MKSPPNPSSIPPWLAYAVFGVLHLAIVVGLLIVIGPEGWMWLLLIWVCQRAIRSYAAWRSGLTTPDEDLEEQELAGAADHAEAAHGQPGSQVAADADHAVLLQPQALQGVEPAGACEAPLWLRVRPVLSEHPTGHSFVIESVEPGRPPGS